MRTPFQSGTANVVPARFSSLPVRLLLALGYWIATAAPTSLRAVVQTDPSSVLPEEPIRSFSLRDFDEAGLIKWELRGDTGLFVSSFLIQIEQLTFRIFDPLPSQNTTIRSPHATIDLRDGNLSGPDFLIVDGPGFKLDGKDWTWSSPEKRLLITNGARVQFSDTVSNILR
ncbi:MAG: hypothetical protein ACFCU4_10130 [Puniceicoccaceae bacterium]